MTAFLGGAQDRLLPASVPFRFFLGASLFHVAAWFVLALAADQAVAFTGGVGPVLAAIHLATLGVLAMTAVGASYQLLPVATRRPLARDWPARLSFWLMAPGTVLLAWGMATVATGAMKTGATLVVAGLAVFAVLTADNLRRAGSMAVVAAHGWAALASLLGLVVLGLLLVWDTGAGLLADRASIAVLHAVVAGYGFMGLLVGGLSLILVPMFALSRGLPKRAGWLQLALAGLALVCFAIAMLTGSAAPGWLALAAGSGAIAAHFRLMQAAMVGRMRRRLGLSFVLIRASWALLAASLGLGWALWAGLAVPNGGTLLGFVLLAGWLLTLLTGVLQRIMPFLASMHASGATGLPPPPSSLTADVPLKVHAACHFAALALCTGGILAGSGHLVRAGAAIGTVGALAFAAFAGVVVRRLKAEKPAA